MDLYDKHWISIYECFWIILGLAESQVVFQWSQQMKWWDQSYSYLLYQRQRGPGMGVSCCKVQKLTLFLVYKKFHHSCFFFPNKEIYCFRSLKMTSLLLVHVYFYKAPLEYFSINVNCHCCGFQPQLNYCTTLLRKMHFVFLWLQIKFTF